ncbi:DNA methylase N-4/N-6 domain protein [Solidesulfovibrio carbinoliphilus subsp. oakridgensis]|uniref:DNA methylase N-4/N-6 domain protein n=1 Tax=Solidesulfovibrio carbinoliphilus subsp. oakridgensis TaxID=694327 RepID=G7QBK3_9BACT|nr:site-specific DNA-methyltransferase [Solidesulfovibrio carbinoliphilus]EHJ48866.1 DNA methylase N-4/N-6 domain protein [Solidesulfovibrio carbinoliphilus subsp. oakridgensis]
MPTLTWLTREEDLKAAGRAPYRLLEPVETYGDPDTENMLIQGDNLEALKALLPYYAGKVKCIYIDPPYNTKSAFEHYDDNIEHTTWISMIYSRLELLRDLLSEDGSIWISIDDHEGHYLKVLMDEIFGRQNFYTTFIWQKVDSPNDNKVPITPDHEFILCYEKSKDTAIFLKKGDISVLNAYSSTDQNGKRYRDRLLKKNGKNSLRQDRPTMFYPLQAPDGTTVYPIHDDGREANWAYGKYSVNKMIENGTLIWKQRNKNGNNVWVPYTREFAPTNPERPHPTILLDVKTTRQAKSHQRMVLPNAQQFDTIKPEQLIQRIFEIASTQNDLVLDSFLGSGTTAAVAHKMGRRYIGVEIGDHAVTHCIPRLQKVIEGEQGGISEAINWQGGGGFRFYRLGETVFDETGGIRAGIAYDHLAAHIFFSETGTPLHAPADAPLLGVHKGVAYYLLYNGVLGDKRASSGNALTSKILAGMPPHDGPKVIYGERTLLAASRMDELRITFKHTPYDIKGR